MSASLEKRLQEFLDRLPSARSIDATHRDSPKTPKRADYLLDENIVIEIKSLQTDQADRGNSVVAEYLKETGIEVFGTLPLSVVAKTDGHLEAIERSIYMRMTRGIERTCKSANRQIQETSSKLQKLQPAC